MIKIGVSGNVGSFSEEAAMHYAQENKIKDYEIIYLIAVDKVLTALNDNSIDLGIFPIENSNGGVVLETVQAMSKHNFSIEILFEINVKHCLLVKKGIKPADIKKISSHPQALKQCRMYLKRKWNDRELEEYADTAEAAKDLGSGQLSKSTAVIAPKRCVELYDLTVMEEGIQDLKFNFTTFIAAKK